jgi:hypothetical protein
MPFVSFASNLYSVNVGVIKSLRMRLLEHVTCMGAVKNAYGILIEKSYRDVPLVRPEHEIKMGFKETE